MILQDRTDKAFRDAIDLATRGITERETSNRLYRRDVINLERLRRESARHPGVIYTV